MKDETYRQLRKLEKMNLFMTCIFLIAYGVGIFAKIDSLKSGTLTALLLSTVTYSSIKHALSFELNNEYKITFFECFLAILILLLFPASFFIK